MLVCAILALALPIKGQDKSTKPNAQRQHADSIEQPNSSIIVVNKQAPTGDKNEASTKSDDYLRHLLLPETLANVILGIVGIVGICIAIKSVKTIQRQAVIMIQQSRILMRQAKASEDAIVQAKTSSDTLANIERAWVDVRLTMQVTPYLYVIEITNYGRTVADVRRIVTESTLIKEGTNPSSASPITTEYRKSKLLVPNQPWSALTVNLDGDFGTGIFQQLRKGEMRFSYKVVVHYASIRPDCRSECLYFWEHANNSGRLTPVEAPEYNPHT
jgi:hypothetical protein